MMKFLVAISRILVGITFVFSGFVKLVDPIGSQYKFEEYFSAEVLNLEFLIPFALPFSILLILVEIMLGVMLLVGYLPKLTTRGILSIMFVFLFLTWYSAYYDKVTDCGCFGDAIKLDNWETFYKNIVLIFLVFFLVAGRKHIKPLFSRKFASISSFFFFFIFLGIVYHVITSLPIIDFRPYAIGNNIPEQMKVVDGKDPKITDFSLMNQELEELMTEVLSEENVLFVVAYDLQKSDKEGFETVKKLQQEAINKGYKVYLLTASMPEELNKLRLKYGLSIVPLFADGTVLKTMIRANPGLITLNQGTILSKANWRTPQKIGFLR